MNGHVKPNDAPTSFDVYWTKARVRHRRPARPLRNTLQRNTGPARDRPAKTRPDKRARPGHSTCGLRAPRTARSPRSCVRTDVIRRLLEPDPARDEIMEIVLDLLVEIRGATEALEMLLQDVCPGPGPAEMETAR
jgi:hypothetical protein